LSTRGGGETQELVPRIVDAVRRVNASAKKSAPHAHFFDVRSRVRDLFVMLERILATRLARSFDIVVGHLTASPAGRSFVANR
jgi:hypothetical protein